MLVLVAIWAFAEAVLWFIVADVPVMMVGLRRGVKAGAVAAFVAALLAAAGGIVTWGWAMSDPAGSRAAIEAVPGISTALFDDAASDYARGGWLAMLAGSFSGVPYKLYAHAAAVTASGLAGFALAGFVVRLPRFLIVGTIAGLIGGPVKAWIGARAMWLIFALCWIAFYTWYLSSR